MGMTIEEAHGILSNGLANAPSEYEWCVAFKMAIDTMRKYQKIEEIMHIEMNGKEALQEIERILRG